MAESLISGLLNAGMDVRITVGEPLAERREELVASYGINAVESNVEALSEAEIAVLAVKPQQLEDVADELGSAQVKLPVAVSIMAGVQMKTLQRKLDCASVVRAMPNTPAQIGFGASAWTASESTPSYALEFTRQMLSAVGEEVCFSDEKLVDIATALSASGPAYVYVFIEALIDGAVQLGMPVVDARELAVQMVLGSASLAKRSSKHPAELRNMVTSPGGTTAAALHALEAGGFRKASIEAVLAAYRRGEVLADLTERG